MSTDAELARWGEPPTSPQEEELAEILQQVLQRLCPGDGLPSASALPQAPPMPAEDPELIRTLSWAQGLAAEIPPELAAPEATTISMPDPFPGEFRLVQQLGEGAFGKVWLAEDLEVGRFVALKLLKPPREALADRLAALRNEARLLGSVRHPNVVQIHAVRPSGQDYYLVLQYVAGGSLAARLKKEGPLPWQQAARYVADVSEALLEVHARGIVHRDVKPDNILWDAEKDEAVLTDFGISCRLANPTAVAGTIPYLAPEAFEGQVAPGLDVFALAATLFRLTTGAVPFPASSVLGHIGAVLDGLPQPDPRCAALPPPLQHLLRQALAAEPRQRPGLAQFVQVLRGTLNQLLTDTLLLPGTATVGLQLVVARERGDALLAPLPAHRPTAAGPDQIQLRMGDRIRVQVQADRDGYVTVFNIGPTGNFHLLCPVQAPGAAAAQWLRANEPLDVLEVSVTPPAGRERLAAVWTRAPLLPDQLHNLAGQWGAFVSQPYRATRDLVRVQQSVQQLSREDWRAVVVELQTQP